MTEKSYGGSDGLSKGKIVNSKADKPKLAVKESKEVIEVESSKIETNNYKKAGEISKQVREYIKSLVKKDMLLLEIAEKIENKTRELGGKPAFPVNLSINDIAAHYTPAYNDISKAQGLLKIDFGVHISGCIVDTALSLDLENSEENKKLIQAAELALKKAIETVKQGRTINETSELLATKGNSDSAQKYKGASISDIGKSIHEEITKLGFAPIRNLSGHSLGEYHIHAGVTIPNYDNGNTKILDSGVYAIEPFSTNGEGVVYDAGMSGIYRLEKIAGVRDSLAREILSYIEKEYSTLPFCSRWIVKKFSTRALISLRFLEQAQAIYQYPQLVEKGHGKVAQAEHTILVDKNIEVIT